MLSRFNAAARPVASLLCVLALTLPAVAWNGVGHMTVAAIAYDNLTPRARNAVDLLLRRHPDYDRWAQGIAMPDEIGRTVFIRAATWPDEIKWDKRFYNDDQPGARPKPALSGFRDMRKHKDWHYVDYPFTTDGTSVSGPPPVNALTAIGALLVTLRNPKGDAALRSYDLPWLIHLVGDLHQPLHCIDRFSRNHPDGDHGGNTFKVSGSARELHTFWDDLLGRKADIDAVNAIEARLVGIYGPGGARALRPAMIKSIDPVGWSHESRDTAKAFVYSVAEGSPGHPAKISAKYRARAAAIVDERVSLAGYRLAAVLNDALKR